MISILKYLPLLAFLLVMGCGSGEQQPGTELRPDTLTVTDAWARPAAEGGTSAVYLTFHNGVAHADTLISVTSEVAGMAQVHESFEQDNGMAGMRHIEPLVLEARSHRAFEPGGYHIMLMQLNKSLSTGERIELEMEFSGSGQLVIPVPVRQQGSN